MKAWQAVLPLLVSIASVSALTVGPVTLANGQLYINYTVGASPVNSVLKCVHHLEGHEELAKVEWVLHEGGKPVGTYVWLSNGGATATGRLEGKVELTRSDSNLELTSVTYDLSGEYSCLVTLATDETQEAAPWEVLIVDSKSHLSSLKRSKSECRYTSSYSTHAMFPKPVVRAGFYSDASKDFFIEIPQSQWKVTPHDNGSFTYSYSEVSFDLNAGMPVDISFYVLVGVMKADSNYIPISSALDEHIILHDLGCPEPRLEEYQHIEYHRDTITCIGEHQETEATVTCEKGFHADGPVDAVFVKCNEATRTWVLENGQTARREHLKCVIGGAPSTTALSTMLLGASCVIAFFRASSLL